MRHNGWPALRGWTDIPDGIDTRRAVYGKVHRAPTDYRWIAWSGGFGAEPPKLERELALGAEETSRPVWCWRSSAEVGPFAVRYYPSRAFDAAGRPAGIEKQILAPAKEPGLDIPPAALAFLLLPEASTLDDTIWWESWRDPRWTSSSHFLPIRDDQSATVSLHDLDQRFEQGLQELFEAVDDDSLATLYAQLFASSAPALLMARKAPLKPLAMAALLLPLDREQTHRISIAGGSLSQSLDPKRFADWSILVCATGTEAPAIVVSEADRSAGSRIVSMLKEGLSHRGSLPVPMSSGGNFLRQYMQSPERWISPGTMGTESLKNVGPWPIVRNPAEASILRECVRSYEATQSPANDERRHVATKADLLRALLLVLCPGQDSIDAVGLPNTRYVPVLYFASRIENRDWEEIAARYGEHTFGQLSAHSFYDCELPAMRKPVVDWLQSAANSSQSSLLSSCARQALESLHLTLH